MNQKLIGLILTGSMCSFADAAVDPGALIDCETQKLVGEYVCENPSTYVLGAKGPNSQTYTLKVSDKKSIEDLKAIGANVVEINSRVLVSENNGVLSVEYKETPAEAGQVLVTDGKTYEVGETRFEKSYTSVCIKNIILSVFRDGGSVSTLQEFTLQGDTLVYVPVKGYDYSVKCTKSN